MRSLERLIKYTKEECTKTPRELIAKHVDWVKDEFPMVHEEDALEALWEFGMACFKEGCKRYFRFTTNDDWAETMAKEFEQELRKRDQEWYDKYLGHDNI